MRLSRPLAWLLILSAVFTAGLLRQFNTETPRSPYFPTALGSLLFAALVLLFLVAAREKRLGAVPGPGIRLGSLTPLLLMLFVEKWVSLNLYDPVFHAISPGDAPAAELDAWFRAFAGAGLLLVCLGIAWFSRPAARRTRRLVRLARFPIGVGGALLAVAGAYAILLGLTRWFGVTAGLELATAGPVLPWILGGQALLAFSEELYYRGLLMSELQRLAPRLGLPSATGRRWLALLATSVLFGMEHFRSVGSWSEIGRELIFTVSLGLLFGILVLVTRNLYFAAAIHAWINWLLLGAAPRLVDATGRPALAAGTYIGMTLILAFVLAFLMQRRRAPRTD